MTKQKPTDSTIGKKFDVVLVEPSGDFWKPGVTRGQSVSDGYALALMTGELEKRGISADYLIQRPIGTNEDFYQGTQRTLPPAPTIKDLAQRVVDAEAKIVGIASKTCYAHNAIELAREIKKRSPKTMIVAGGYHPSGWPEILSDSKGAFDLVVLGAGEKVFGNLCEDMLNGRDPTENRPLEFVPELDNPNRIQTLNKGAISYMCGERIVQANRTDRDFYETVDDIPIPKRKLEQQEGCVSGVLSRTIPPKQTTATTQTTRGCQGNCSYCSTGNIYGVGGKRLANCNSRSPENVIKELRGLSQMGVNFVFFTDPTFNQDGQHMTQIAKRIIEEKKAGTLNPDMDFYALLTPFNEEQMKARGLDYSQYSALKQAGFSRLGLGVESTQELALEHLNRRNTLSDLEKHLEKIHQNGMFVRGFLMYGHEDETPESLAQYPEVMKNLSVDEWRIAPLTPAVGTQMGNDFLVNNLQVDFKNFDSVYPVSLPKAILDQYGSHEEAAQDLMKWQRNVLKQVYQSPEWNARINETHQNFPELREGIDFFRSYLDETFGKN